MPTKILTHVALDHAHTQRDKQCNDNTKTAYTFEHEISESKVSVFNLEQSWSNPKRA